MLSCTFDSKLINLQYLKYTKITPKSPNKTALRFLVPSFSQMILVIFVLLIFWDLFMFDVKRQWRKKKKRKTHKMKIIKPLRTQLYNYIWNYFVKIIFFLIFCPFPFHHKRDKTAKKHFLQRFFTIFKTYSRTNKKTIVASFVWA